MSRLTINLTLIVCLSWLTLLQHDALAQRQEAPASQEETGPSAPIPDDLDPEAPAGWHRIELAVLVDVREKVLNGEQWQSYPTVNYPSRYRRLLDPLRQSALEQEFPSAVITAFPSGEIEVALEDPTRALSLALIEEQTRLAEEAAEAAAAQAIMAGASEEAGDQETLDLGESPSSVPQKPWDFIDNPEEQEAQPPPLDSLLDEGYGFSAADEAAENTMGLPLMTDESLLRELEPVPEPRLPTPFVKGPLLSLANGIAAVQRETGDRLELAASWLHAPDSSLPIVLDDSGDTLLPAPLQGFIQLRHGDPLKIGVNFWRATAGNYMPATFVMAPPPKAPQSISFKKLPAQTNLSREAAQDIQRRLTTLEEFLVTGQPLSTFSGTQEPPPTGAARKGEGATGSSLTGDSAPEWRYRHLIHVADTRTLEDGVIRYFDHPVIKIVVTHKELTWGEVYTLGYEEYQARKRAEITTDSEGQAVADPRATNQQASR
jgi:hypothetical protein